MCTLYTKGEKERGGGRVEDMQKRREEEEACRRGGRVGGMERRREGRRHAEEKGG